MSKVNPVVALLGLIAFVLVALWMLLLRPPARFQLVRQNDQEFYLIDTQTGHCWKKSSNAGPADWDDATPKDPSP